MEKWKATRIMSKENYLNKIKDLPETVKQFGGLVLIVLIIFFSFSVLNIMFGGGDELVRKMKYLKNGLDSWGKNILPMKKKN